MRLLSHYYKCTAARALLFHSIEIDLSLSATSEESLRDSEPPDFFLPDTWTGDFMRSECIKLVLVSF